MRLQTAVPSASSLSTLARAVRTALGLAALLLASSAAACGGGAVGKPPIVRQSLDDAQTTAAVKSALLNDAQIGTQAIDVRVSQGIVSLTGMVRSTADVSRAEQIARQVSGVRDVKSGLAVQR